MMNHAVKHFFCSIILLNSMFLVSCSSIGPVVLPNNRQEFNVALQRSEDEQLLLNLVRMQFTDAPYFLGVSGISSQFSIDANLAGSMSMNHFRTLGDFASRSTTTNGFVDYGDRPTISYSPLQGEAFTKQMLTPMSMENFLLLLQSGWSVARVLRVTTQSLGDIPNAPSAARPSTSHMPKYKAFMALAHLIRSMQVDGAISVSVSKQHDTLELIIHLHRNARNAKCIRRFYQLLNRPDDGQPLKIVQEVSIDAHALQLELRSVIGMMYYLAKSVEVTDEEKRTKIVDFPKNPNGSYFDWKKVTAGMMIIHAANERPANAVVAVYYRHRWFYIDDRDTNSKETLSLMSMIFNLQAGNVKANAPVLTLPV